METWTCPSLGECRVPNPSKRVTHYVSDMDLMFRVANCEEPTNSRLERAGIREKIYFDVTPEFTVGIVTCGGLCPGLNSVIRSLVITLCYTYGVKRIKGFRYGFEGLKPGMGGGGTWMWLDPRVVESIHHFGGSLIGTSRGPQPVSSMVDCLVTEGVSVLFTIGGDGTLRGASAICEEIHRRKLCISVIGVPKTIDNDIPLTERSFGFATAVARAVSAISSAHCEAFSHERGLALVKLMGRDSGFIALEATIASGDVNLCLIPECKFDLDSVVAFVEHRLAIRNHCVVVVAEGAGQDCFGAGAEAERDASGNVRFVDVGVELKKVFEKRLKGITLKYIDPSYIIRSAPADPHDEEFCVLMAQMAVHAAMAGKTDMTVSFMLGEFCHVPLSKIHGRKHVELTGPLYQAMLDNVGQPPCLTCSK